MPAKIDIKFEWCTVNRKLLMVSTKQHQAAELPAKIDIRFEYDGKKIASGVHS